MSASSAAAGVGLLGRVQWAVLARLARAGRGLTATGLAGEGSQQAVAAALTGLERRGLVSGSALGVVPRVWVLAEAGRSLVRLTLEVARLMLEVSR